jgi:purine nucleosidase
MARRILIDCDPGTDDALALWLALAASDLALEVVTVAGGNVGVLQTLSNALSIVALAHSLVPVHAGADQPILGRFVDAAHVHGADGLAGVRLPPGGVPSPGIACDVIRATLRAGRTTLVGIGPASNLALALASEPALVGQVEEIVLMAGAWGEGNITAAAEFNAASDPEALAVLLACGAKLTLVPLDLTHQALATPRRLAALRHRGGGACLAAACDIIGGLPVSGRHVGAPLHDPCAVAWLIEPDLFTYRACPVSVELAFGLGRGRTYIDRWQRSGSPARVKVLETIDVDGFFDLLGAHLALLP